MYGGASSANEINKIQFYAISVPCSGQKGSTKDQLVNTMPIAGGVVVCFKNSHTPTHTPLKKQTEKLICLVLALFLVQHFPWIR